MRPGGMKESIGNGKRETEEETGERSVRGRMGAGRMGAGCASEASGASWGERRREISANGDVIAE